MIRIDENKLVSAFASVLLFRSDDETRAHMCNLFVRVHGKQLSVVATDGRALALWEDAIENLDGVDEALLVDAGDASAVVKDIRRIRGTARGEATLSLAAESVVLSTKKHLHLRVVPGLTFPAYEQVLPKARDRAPAAVLGLTSALIGRIDRAFGGGLVVWEPTGGEASPILISAYESANPLRVVVMPATGPVAKLPVTSSQKANGTGRAKAPTEDVHP